MNNLNATRKGIIISALMIIASLTSFYIFHLPDNGNSQYLTLSVFIAGIIWTLYDFHKKNPDTTFKKYFGEGFKAFIAIALLMVIFAFIFYKLNPQIMEQGIKENNELLRKQGNKTEAEIVSNANQLRSIYIPVMLSLTTIKYLFLGALSTAVIAGLFLQKKQVSSANIN
jgi:F0F1-type ATP synthase assembly protein I